MTAFALLIKRCGLSLSEAADFLSVRIDTVKSWSSGRNPVPEGVIDELRALYAKIERAADNLLAIIEDADDDEEIEIGYASDDKEANGLGWPCAGAQHAAIGLTIARSDRDILLSPRGSTLATAAAADVHNR